MAYLSLIAGLFLLIFSGNGLVKGSVQLARYFKISTLVIGLTVVAFGTSTPELFVSIKAAFKGAPDLAIGNVVGSNIANIGLILGLVAAMMPIALKRTHILKDWLVMTLASLMLAYAVLNGSIGFIEGSLFLIFLISYVSWSIYGSKKNIKEQEEAPQPTMPMWKAIVFVLASVIGLYYGADWFVSGASTIAQAWGISDRVIGVSVVAFGTSVPELVTSLVAMYRKESDISVGNIIGSNIFNIWAILGTTAVLTPLPVNDINNMLVDIAVSFAFALILLIFILPLKNGVITRWKGVILFLLYISYIFFTFKK